ncbi:MAG TPA: Rpn family recombination-promoting nuclease/putative transposase [Candidatus Merdenecus merdavium]|nr:Rpn family recombination-promoting nuclease/putative transposase [Candidatus Merdenecus merdavium]
MKKENKKPLLSPKSDLIFKLIFGDRKNIDILSDLLQAVLDLPKEELLEITIVDPHLHPESPDNKLGILDLKLHTKSHKRINVEIQVLRDPHMRQRVVYYNSKMVVEQLSKGDRYGELNPSISIIILDYCLIKENDVYHNKYQLYDRKTHSTFTDMVEINTLELPKLPTEPQRTKLWEWLTFFVASKEEEFDMISQENPMIKKAVGVLKELSEDERTRLLEEAREKARKDEASRYEGALEIGREEGRVEGRKEGRKEGREEGKKEGRVEERYNIAKKMKDQGINMDIIESVTGLSKEELETI